MSLTIMSKPQPLFPALKVKRILDIHIPYDVTIVDKNEFISYTIDALDVTIVVGKNEEELGAIFIPGKGEVVLHNMTELKRLVKSIRDLKPIKTDSNIWEWIIYSTERTIAVFVAIVVAMTVTVILIASGGGS